MPLWKKLSISSKSQTFIVDGNAPMLEQSNKESHRRRNSNHLPSPKKPINREAILDQGDNGLVQADDQPCIDRRRRRRPTLGSAFRNMFSVFRKGTKIERVASKRGDENICQMVADTSNRNGSYLKRKISMIDDRCVYRFWDSMMLTFCVYFPSLCK